MDCPKCRHENLDDSRFCQECGTQLVRVCSGCQTENPPSAKFCRECGGSLATESAPPRAADDQTRAVGGGRRQLTVMFCDLVGSTALSGRLDPEDLHAVVHSYREACAAVIKSLEGHVAQYLGDGLLVYFGYPRAHEDDAQRAVRAALEIVDAVEALRPPSADGEPLQVRIGLHTGVVVLGGVGEDRHGQLAMGEVPNVAARLQSIAEPGTVVLSDTTHRLVAGYFRCSDLGAKELRGREQPIHVYRALEASDIESRFELQVSTGLTPLVGRERELSVLLERWHEVEAGHGQVIWLCGEAGIGKSRLLRALRERLAEASQASIECRCSAYHRSSALYPVIEYLYRFLRFDSGDSPAAKVAKLEAALSDYHFPGTDTLPLLAALLSLPLPNGAALLALTPERQKQRTLEALVAWQREAAERAPLAFILEDLHWADPSTLDFLKLLIDSVADARILLLLTHRPEFAPPWEDRPNLNQLNLVRLERGEVEEMVGRVTGGRVLPAAIVDQIALKTGGVPLLIEELTKTMIESSWLREVDNRYELTGTLPPPAIPASLQDWLMARLDQLAPFREVAQIGAILGREFSQELIRAVSPFEPSTLDQALEGLVAAQLLHRHGSGHQVRYVFKHALIQDAAYESLLKSRRQQYHALIAETLERSFEETASTQPELVAHHYAAAGLDDRALPHWRRAGDRAAARGAHVEAAGHYSTALESLLRGSETRTRDQQELELLTLLALSLASTRGYASAEVQQTYNRAHDLCQRLGETAEVFPVLRGLCTFYIVRDQQPKARQLAEQCLRIAEESQRADYIIEGFTPVGYVLTYQGEFARAREFLTKGIDLYRECRHEGFGFVTPQDSGVACLGLLAVVMWLLGYPDQALTRANECLALAHELEHPFNLAYAYNYSSGIHTLRGAFDKAIEDAQKAFDISATHGFDAWRITAMVHLTMAQHVFGDRDLGVAKLTEALAAWRATGAELSRPLFLADLAEMCRLAGRFEEAMAAVEEALASSNESGDFEFESLLYRVRGSVRMASDRSNVEAAERDFRTAVDVARRQEAKSFELEAALSLSHALRVQGRRAEARDVLLPVYSWFTEGFETFPLRQAELMLSKLG